MNWARMSRLKKRAPYNNAFQRTQRSAAFLLAGASYAARVAPLNLAVMPHTLSACVI